MTLKEKQLADFNGDEYLASEYSIHSGCLKSDSGYHCSCYDKGLSCDICEQDPTENDEWVKEHWPETWYREHCSAEQKISDRSAQNKYTASIFG